MSRTPTTAVIGAGISGLTACKNLADKGIEYDCFESSDRIGGNWAFRNPNGHSSAYRSLHIDTSKEQLSFRDYAIPEAFPDFPHHTQIKQYLEGYAAEFGLKQRIQFENGVEHAERLPNGGWKLRTQDGQTRYYDVLVVANGHHWDPRYPDFPGEFSGESMHAHGYIDPREPLDLQNKRIVVVGIGNTAADLVSELAQKSWSNEVIISTRSGSWIVPKYLFGLPLDKLLKTLPYIPLSWQRIMMRPLAHLFFSNPKTLGLPKPNHHFLEAHVTQSVELPLRLGSGDARAKPNIERLDGRNVHFADGSVEEVDVIIYATGYNISFPFFDPAFLSAPDNRLPLFKRMFKPGIDDLVFAGFGQAIPTLFPFVECQARLLAAYVAGEYRPPAQEEMQRVIVADQTKYCGHYHESARHTQQLDYYDYERDLRKRELPAGRRRVGEHGAIPLAGRVDEYRHTTAEAEVA